MTSSMCSGKTSVKVTSPLKSSSPALYFAVKVKSTMSPFCTSPASSVESAVNEIGLLALATPLPNGFKLNPRAKCAPVKASAIATKQATIAEGAVPLLVKELSLSQF